MLKKKPKTCTHVVAAVPDISLNEISEVDPKAVSSGYKTFMVFGDLEFELERLSSMSTLFESGKLQIYLTI